MLSTLTGLEFVVGWLSAAGDGRGDVNCQAIV